jgi:uncharacterized SAM-binding protein YcdF (DUF218 family)
MMVDIKAISITTMVVVATGAVFLMIYWVSIIVFPMIILGFIAVFTYTISSNNVDKPDEKPPRYDFRT